MARETSYSAARARLASLCDEVAEGTEPIYITRRGAPTVALIAASELRGLEETAHLLRSPANARGSSRRSLAPARAPAAG